MKDIYYYPLSWRKRQVQSARQNVRGGKPIDRADYDALFEFLLYGNVAHIEGHEIVKSLQVYIRDVQQSGEYDDPYLYVEYPTNDDDDDPERNIPINKRWSSQHYTLTELLNRYDRKADAIPTEDSDININDREMQIRARLAYEQYQQWLLGSLASPELINDLDRDDKYLNKMQKYYERQTTSKVQESVKKRIIRQAMRFATNPKFQQALELFRERWNITVTTVPEFMPNLRIVDVLENYVFEEPANPIKWVLFQQTMEDYFFANTDVEMSYAEDYGILIYALCFGLSPHDIQDKSRLDLLVHLGIQQLQNAIGLEMQSDQSGKWLGAMQTITFLANKLMEMEQNLDKDLSFMYDSEHPIAQWIEYASVFSNSVLGEGGEAKNAERIIKQIQGEPNSQNLSEVGISLPISATTTRTDIENAWNRIDAERHYIYSADKIKRQSSSYQRNVELLTLMNQGLSPRAAIIEYRKIHPDSILDPDNPADVEMVKQIRKRNS